MKQLVETNHEPHETKKNEIKKKKQGKDTNFIQT